MYTFTGRRTAKVLGLLIGGLAGVTVLVLLAVWMLVNPDDYKDRIAEAVKASTGRELRLDGNLKLSLFPWVALTFGPAALGNPPGFGDGPFLALKHAAVRVRLWPLLLHRSLSIGRIDLDGLEVRLHRNAAGRGNWEGFGSAAHPPAAPGAGASAAQPAGRLEGLDGLRITHARVSFEDLSVEALQLESGRFADGAPVPVVLSFELRPGTAAGRIGVAVNTQLTADFAAQKYALAALDVNGTLALTRSGRSVAWNITAPALGLDLKEGTLALPAFTAQLGAAHLSGSVQATRLTGAPAATGSIKIAPVDLREWLARLDLPTVATRDPKALTQFGAAADFNYGEDAARIGPLEVTLDDTRLRGAAAVTALSGPKVIRFDLSADRIDVDRYLPPAKPVAVPAPAASPSSRAAPGEAGPPLAASGTLAVGAVTVAGLAVTNLKVTLNAKGRVTHLYPSVADLYGGHYSGDITLDQSGAVPALSIDEHLKGIDVAQLLAERYKSRRLTGHGNVDLKITARGAGREALLRSANGRVEATLADGAVEGVDLGYQIGLAQSLIDKTAAPAAANTGRTRFDSFKAAATLLNGIATVRELNIASANLQVSGGGTANIATQMLDLKVLASILNAPAGAGRTISLADIPVAITGSAADPAVRLDLGGLARTQLRQKVQDKLQDALKGRLKDLFGK